MEIKNKELNKQKKKKQVKDNHENNFQLQKNKQEKDNNQEQKQQNNKQNKKLKKIENKQQKNENNQSKNNQENFKEKKNKQVIDDNNQGVRNVDEFKKYFGALISKNGNKQKIIQEVLKNFGSFLNKLALKKLPCKVIQQCIKQGNKQTQENIINKIIKEDLVEIIKSRFGRCLAKRCIKYGTKEQRNQIFKVLLENLNFIITHQEASQVLDYYTKTITTPHQLTEIKNKLKVSNMLKANENKNEVEKTEELENMAMKLIEKNLIYNPLQMMVINQAFNLLVKQEQDKIISTIKDQIFTVCNNKEALQLIITIINNSDNKFRKNIIKQTKSMVLSFIQDEQPFKSLLLLKLLFSIDDTKLLNKTVLKEIVAGIDLVYNNNNGSKMLFCILNKEYHTLNQYEVTENLFSKKDQDTRNNEVIQQLIQPLSQYVFNNLDSKMLINNYQSRIIQFVIESNLQNQDNKNLEFISQIISYFVQEILENKTQLFDHPDSHRVLKLIIIKAKKDEEVDKSLLPLVDAFTKNQNITQYLETKAVFVFISLIENTTYQKQIIKILKLKLQLISEQNKSKSGVQILLKLI